MRNASPSPPRPRRSVLVLSPGGRRARGGIGRMVTYFAGAWPVPDLPLTVVDTYGPGFKPVMPFYFAGAVLSLLWAGATGQAAAVHIHMSERLSVVRKGILVYLARALGVPVILHLHGADFADWFQGLAPVWQQRVRRMIQCADRLVVLGRAWETFALTVLEMPAGRVAVLHNAVPTPDLAARRAPVAGAPCRLLVLGEVGLRKGSDVLLEALANPVMRRSDWTVDIAGNGEVERFQARAATLGLGPQVRFLGWTSAATTRDLLAGADVLVLPSRNEGLPIAILEAMSWHLAVVATPVGTIADAIEHQRTGLLVPPGDAAALAAALAALLDDPGLRLRLARAARERHLTGFALPPYLAGLEAVFRAAIAEHQARAPRARMAALVDRLSLVEAGQGVEAALALTDTTDTTGTTGSPAGAPLILSFCNQHAFNLAWSNPGFCADLAGSGVVLRDGVGMAVALRWLGRSPGINLNGTDLIPLILQRRRGQRVVLAGTRLPWLAAAAAHVAAAGLQVVGTVDGFQSDEAVITLVTALRPDLVVLGMGMPKQERIARTLAAACPFPVLIINGGAILDFWAGRFPRAPALLRRLGLEWAFRLGQEPGRLWRRYGPGGLHFVIRVLLLRQWRKGR